MKNSILIGGDLVINNQAPNIVLGNNLVKLFNNSNYNILNLECPVFKSNLAPILKSGPSLKGEYTKIKQILQDLKVDLVTLSNNHILDYDLKGLEETLEFCQTINLNTVGAGLNKENVLKAHEIIINEKRISILNISENEWSSLKGNRAGAFGFDYIDCSRRIIEEKSKCDYLIVIYHGGKEYYELPTPELQRRLRWLIDLGVEAVIGHHTHCIGGMEKYNGKKIYYSLGNFLFTEKNKNTDWYYGLLLELRINEEDIMFKPHFIHLKEDLTCLDLIDPEKQLERHNDISDVIQDEYRLLKSFEALQVKEQNWYLEQLSVLGGLENKYIKYGLRKLGFGNLRLRKRLFSLNLMRCETHAELLKASIENLIKKN